MMIPVGMIIVSMMVAHGVADRRASDAAHHRAYWSSDGPADHGAADPAGEGARFVRQGKRG
jgi:hypothetical protein